MAAKNGDFLFVYGTLLSTAGHSLGAFLRDRAELVGEGTIRARLYIVEEVDADGVNRYPAALPVHQRDDRVWGEVYRITDAETLMPRLDAFEACAPGCKEPYEFLPRAVEVTMAGGDAATAWSYLYTYDVTGMRHIPSGRFEGAMPGAR